MAYDKTLATRVSRAVGRRKGFTHRKMFGGIGFLLNGNMCIGVWKGSLIVRLALDDYDAVLCEPHVRQFDITGRPMKGWVLVGPDVVKDDAELGRWIAQAIDYVRLLPAK